MLFLFLPFLVLAAQLLEEVVFEADLGTELLFLALAGPAELECVLVDLLGFPAELDVAAGGDAGLVQLVEGDALLRCGNEGEIVAYFLLADLEFLLEDAPFDLPERSEGRLHLLVHEPEEVLEVHGVATLVDLHHAVQFTHRILKYIAAHHSQSNR